MGMANGFKLTTHQKADALKEIDQIILYIEEKEAINYSRCSAELVCKKCDGFGYIEEANEFRTYLCDCQEDKPIT